MSRPALGSHRNNRLYILKQAIRTLQVKHLDHYRIGVTYDQILSLYCTPEQAEVGRAAQGVFHVGAYYHGEANFKWKSDIMGRTLPLSLALDHAKILPANKNVLAHEDNAELIQQLDEQISQQARLAMDYARAIAVLDALDEQCTTPQQIRYLWPAFLIVCAACNDEQVRELGESLNTFKAPSNLPVLPLGLREACKRTSVTLTGSQLLPEAKDKKFEIEVTLGSFKFKEPDMGEMSTP